MQTWEQIAEQIKARAAATAEPTRHVSTRPASPVEGTQYAIGDAANIDRATQVLLAVTRRPLTAERAREVVTAYQAEGRPGPVRQYGGRSVLGAVHFALVAPRQ